MHCPSCSGEKLRKAGPKGGYQRYRCMACLKYFTDRPPRFSPEVKAQALDMYMNNVGIRKIARFVGASPAGVLRWIRKAHASVQERLIEAGQLAANGKPDIIEMDEIYTFVQKNGSER